MFKRGGNIILGYVISKKSTPLYIINTKERKKKKKKITFKGLIGIFSQLGKLQIVQQKNLLSYPLYFSQQNMLLPNNSLQTHYFSK